MIVGPSRRTMYPTYVYVRRITKKIKKTYTPKSDAKTSKNQQVEKDLLFASFGAFDIRSTIEQHTELFNVDL